MLEIVIIFILIFPRALTGFITGCRCLKTSSNRSICKNQSSESRLADTAAKAWNIFIVLRIRLFVFLLNMPKSWWCYYIDFHKAGHCRFNFAWISTRVQEKRRGRRQLPNKCQIFGRLNWFICSRTDSIDSYCWWHFVLKNKSFIIIIFYMAFLI